MQLPRRPTYAEALLTALFLVVTTLWIVDTRREAARWREVHEAAANLQAEVQAFDRMSWRAVVPRVKRATDRVVLAARGESR